MPVFQLNDQILFPHPDFAEDNGLLAIGGDLQPKRLLAAYRHGIFPWYSEGDPILWWFTSPRLVLLPDEFHLPKRLARKMRQQPFEIRFDTDFRGVIERCAANRADNDGTWILPEIQHAYLTLHEMGYAHSVECWQGDTLAGGLYGIRLDRCFFGESMFTCITDASKIALTALVQYVQQQGVKVIDCQMTTQHLLRFGAREIEGHQFQKILHTFIQSIQPDGKWKNDR